MPRVKDMSAQEFEALYNAKDVDEQFAKMDYVDQRMFLLRAIALADPRTAELSGAEIDNIVINEDFVNKEVLNALYDYFLPSDIKKSKKTSSALSGAVFGLYKSTDIYIDNVESAKLTEEARIARTEMQTIVRSLGRKRQKNPVQVTARDEAVVWKRNQFNMVDWFPDKKLFETKMGEAGLPFAADMKSIKNLFQTWLIAEKGFSLQQVAYANATLAETKVALGAEFLNEMGKHAFTGVLEGGAGKASENISWFGNMYKTAMKKIMDEKVQLPMDDKISEKGFIDIANTKTGFLMGYAHDLVNDLETNWMKFDNRPNVSNNYGVNVGAEFLSGYGSPYAFESDMNEFRAFAALEHTRRSVEQLAKNNSKKGVRAYLLLNAKQSITKVRKATKDRIAIDGSNMMMWAKTGEKSAMKVTEPDAELYADFLRTKKLTKADIPKYEEINNMSLEDYGKTAKNLVDEHFKSVEDAIKTINNNHREAVYNIPDVSVFSSGSYELYGDDANKLTMMQLDDIEAEFDRIFAPLIKCEQQTLRFRVGDKKCQPDDYLKWFKLNDKPIWDVALDKILGRVTGVDALENVTQDVLKKFTKAWILYAMKDPKPELTYITRVMDPKTNKLIGKEYDLDHAKTRENVNYDDMDYIQKTMSDLVTGCDAMRRIDVWYHHNSKDFKNMCTEMEKLSRLMSKDSIRNEISRSEVSQKNWYDLEEQLEATNKAIDNYVTKRTGTTNSVSIRRLAALTGVKKILKEYDNIYMRHNTKRKKAEKKPQPQPTR